MILPLYRTLTTVSRPLIRLFLAYRRAQGKEDPQRFNERLGQPGRQRPKGLLIWVHAASVGESLSLLPLIHRLLDDHAELHVLMTTGTVTSARLMTERLPPRAFHQYVPVDCLAYVRPFLEHWHPDLVLWAESEFWPNMISESHARGIPMVLINGRISPRSFVGWQRQSKLIKQLLTSFRLCLGQTEKDAERLRALGAESAQCLGNLKFAAAPLPADENALTTLKTQIGSRPHWLAASTHPGEEDIIAQAHVLLRSTIPNVLSIVVPRHPERGDRIRKVFEDTGLTTAQRSLAQPITPQTDVYIADSLGELGLFFRLCDIIFMGKSLVSQNDHMGGQNPLEPARLQCAIVQGPHTMNFADITERMHAAQAFCKVTDQETLADTVQGLFNDDKLRHRFAQAAAEFAETESGVLDRLSVVIAPLLSKNTIQDQTDANA